MGEGDDDEYMIERLKSKLFFWTRACCNWKSFRQEVQQCDDAIGRNTCTSSQPNIEIASCQRLDLTLPDDTHSSASHLCLFSRN